MKQFTVFIGRVKSDLPPSTLLQKYNLPPSTIKPQDTPLIYSIQTLNPLIPCFRWFRAELSWHYLFSYKPCFWHILCSHKEQIPVCHYNVNLVLLRLILLVPCPCFCFFFFFLAQTSLHKQYIWQETTDLYFCKDLGGFCKQLIYMTENNDKFLLVQNLGGFAVILHGYILMFWSTNGICSSLYESVTEMHQIVSSKDHEVPSGRNGTGKKQVPASS